MDSVTNMLNRLQFTMVKHGPEILTGIGIAGMVTTTILAVRETPKAIRLLEEEADNKGDELTAPEKVKTCWKCYIPAAITGVTSIACLIGASSVNSKRNAALAAAYNISTAALTEYKDKVIETVGEKKERAIRDEIAKDKIEQAPVHTKEIIMTGRGKTLCYDGIFGRYFESDMDTIRRALNTINREIIHGDMYVSLNDFYDAIGIGPIPIGNDLGWNIDDGEIEVDFSAQLTEDDRPCIVLTYNVAPRYNYSRYI